MFMLVWWKGGTRIGLFLLYSGGKEVSEEIKEIDEI